MRDQPGNLISLRAQISGDDPAAAKRVALHILHCIEELLPPNLQLGPPGRVPGTRELVIPKTPFIVPTECTTRCCKSCACIHAKPRGCCTTVAPIRHEKSLSS
jgi:toxin ParE1/3/4